MTQRLIRVFLALAVAFVFTGRMEAAAQHCAKLIMASEAAAPVEQAHAEHATAQQADAMPCHGMEEGEAATTADRPAPHTPATESCECVAVLKACATVAEASASARIEPYIWARPAAIAFASVEPAPDLRPPRT